MVTTGRHDFTFGCHRGEVRENLGDIRRACRYFNVSTTTACPPIFHKINVLLSDLEKRHNQQVWNIMLNYKVCIGQISGTWEILICKYGRKSMGISEKILTSKS